MDKIQKRKIVRILITIKGQGVIKKWRQLCDSLDIEEYVTEINKQYKNGTVEPFDLINGMLENWMSTFGKDATIKKLVEVLREDELNNAADAIESYYNNPETTDTTFQRNLKMLDRLGRGEFSEVYKARKTFGVSVEVETYYAIKRISIGKFISQTKATLGQDYFFKLLREVNVMARLEKCDQVVRYIDAWFEGPNAMKYHKAFTASSSSLVGDSVIPVETTPKISVEEDATFFCIQMPLCDKNLEMWMEDNENRELIICGKIVQEILKGLEYIHEEGILHRDLKPTDIFLNILGKGPGKFCVKIGDFGLARDVQIEKGGDLTCNLKADFSSPEMHLGRGDYDEKTDIYSLGLIYLILVYQFGSDDEMKWTFSGLRKSLESNNKVWGQIIGKLRERHVVECDFKLLRSMLSFQKENRPTATKARAELGKIL